ncbi:hypothetical protein K492DRAFT_199012 [Lichtheimia hyalospora FSU 10163]|nr:hypothetical protein K492DRAFT_199012 [Lichtheimia hyalospora FSU 10163]
MSIIELEGVLKYCPDLKSLVVEEEERREEKEEDEESKTIGISLKSVEITDPVAQHFREQSESTNLKSIRLSFHYKSPVPVDWLQEPTDFVTTDRV